MPARASPRHTQVADRLHSAAIHVLRHVRRQDEALGVGPAGLSALSVLVFAGPRSLGALAAAEQVKPPTMSRLVSGLERDGLATRVPDPADGRGVVVQATPKGRRVLLAGRRRRVAALAHRLSGLTNEELDRLHEAAELMERISRSERG